jgi:hypothetical protein
VRVSCHAEPPSSLATGFLSVAFIHEKLFAQRFWESYVVAGVRIVPDFLSNEAPAMLFRTTLIAAAIVAMATPVNAQQSPPQRGIRIITPYSEHVYSPDPAAPQQLPDDEALRQQNAESWRQFQIDNAKRQQEEMGGE